MTKREFDAVSLYFGCMQAGIGLSPDPDEPSLVHISSAAPLANETRTLLVEYRPEIAQILNMLNDSVRLSIH